MQTTLRPHRRRQGLLRTREAARRAHPAGDAAASAADAEAAAAGLEPAAQALAAENGLLLRELARVQQRWTSWRDESALHIDRLEAELVRQRALCIVKDTQLAALREAHDTLRKRSALWLTNEELLRRLSDLRARNRSLESELGERAVPQEPEARAPSGQAQAARTMPEARETASSRAEADTRLAVLCVGGRSRHVPVFRELVERRGARFAHTSGAAADDPQRLERLLAEADVVIVQSSYVCRDACRAVELHCQRTGKRWRPLDKPCTEAFARCLAQMHVLQP